MNSAPPSQVITAVLDRDRLATALAAVSAAQTEGDVGWIQLHFVGNGQVVLSAVSHNISIKFEFSADYKGQGVIKVSGRQLSDYVKQLPPEKISLTADLPQKLSLKCGRSSARLQLVQDQSHTEIMVPQVGTCISVKGELLERWVSKFREFVMVDDTRYYANGAYIWADAQGSLHAVASDALRLAKADLIEGIKIEALDNSAVLVPKKALDELRRICSQEPGRDFILRWHQDSLFFAIETESYAMVSKCISGKYPPYESAIPQKINLELSLDLGALTESVRRVLLFSDKARTIKFNFDGPVLDVQSFTPGLKEGEEIVELETPVENAFEVNYNGNLLTGIMNVLPGKKILFSWENVNRPVKVTGEKERGVEVFYLLVPTRY
jgi:DNA polymerase-3 subunit beta